MLSQFVSRKRKVLGYKETQNKQKQKVFDFCQGI